MFTLNKFASGNGGSLGGAWAFETPFKFWGLVSTQNNSVLVASNQCLVALNLPRLTPQLVKQIHDVEKETNTKVSYLVETDWHHLFIDEWLAEFPTAKVVLPGYRAQRFHPNVKPEQMLVSREAIELPGVSDQDVVLLPWQGFEGVYYKTPEEKLRGEWSVWLPSTKTLFIFDIMIPALPSLGSMVRGMFGGGHSDAKIKYGPNFGSDAGSMKGFASVLDKEKAIASVKRVVAAGEQAERLIMAHGGFKRGAFMEGNAEVKKILEHIREDKLG